MIPDLKLSQSQIDYLKEAIYADDRMLQNDVIMEVVRWNIDRGLLGLGSFNVEKEIGFIIEELLETTKFYQDPANKKDKKDAVKYFVNKLIDFEDIGDKQSIADAFGDIIVFAIGTIAKLGYNPHEVLRRITIANRQKGSKLVDGKIVKDETFVEPNLD